MNEPKIRMTVQEVFDRKRGEHETLEQYHQRMRLAKRAIKNHCRGKWVKK